MNYIIRHCRSADELESCVALQKKVWGYSDHEVYPLRLFVNIQRVGGHVIGAFTARGEMAGFVAALPAWHGRRRFLHSLSLGVLPDHENQGLGRALKLEQRKAALKDGISCIEWTFDPMRSKNAFLNIMRLGAIVRRYLPDFYRRVDSQLQLGLPSDRLVAEWWLKSPRVKRVLKGKPARAERKPPAAKVAVPLDLDALVATSLERAREWQLRVRDDLGECFRRKLVITGFERTETEGRFLLDRL